MGRQRRVFAILLRFLRERGGREPTVILLEDLQWFDPASLEFAKDLAATALDSALLLVANSRLEFEASWPDSTSMLLGPLARDAVDGMLVDLLGPHDSLRQLCGEIRERARGNPFFVEEVVQALVAAESLAGSRGG